MERKISSKPVDVSRLSPMMRQYWKVKEQYLEQLLFFRLGDFYELFFDDALIASRELELTLTGKECGLDERAPMCGIPYHSCENYIARLVNLRADGGPRHCKRAGQTGNHPRDYARYRAGKQYARCRQQ